MGRPRRKKGKTARRARQGLLGLSATALALDTKRKRPKQFEKRVERRLETKDQRQTEEVLRENVAGSGAEASMPPHSFVIHTGRVGRYVRQLERDLRRVMSPHTSKTLRVTKRNNFKDFLVNAQFLGVSHLMVLTRTELSTNLRIIRNPQGPTLHFKVESYSLARDVLTVQKRPVIYEELFQHPPLVVMNGFNPNNTSDTGSNKQRHLQLVQTLVQHMFPPIDVDKVKLVSVRRALLVHYDAEQDLIEFRHYSIRAVPAGVSRSTKKLLQSKVPDLSRYADISDYMLKPEQLSDSEFEGEQAELVLPQDIGGRGKKRGQQTKLRLMEIGPRMSLRLTKIEEGINEGEVLYHAYVEKSAKELAQLRSMAPMNRKKRLRREKRVEHETIRKLRHRAANDAKRAELGEHERRRLIGQQREVSGDYGGDSDDDDEAASGEQRQRHSDSNSRRGTRHAEEADDEADLDSLSDYDNDEDDDQKDDQVKMKKEPKGRGRRMKMKKDEGGVEPTKMKKPMMKKRGSRFK